MRQGSGRRGAAMSRSFKGALVGVCVVGVAMASAQPASANFPHFRSFSVTTVSPDGAAGTASSRTTASDPTTLPDLRYVWTEVGLGATDVTYEASTVVTATFGCVNGGSNRPSASNKTTISAPVSATVRLSAERNGRIAGNLDLDTAGVGPAGFDCPPGQDLTTISASFTQITLTDVTNDTSVTADDITVILKP